MAYTVSNKCAKNCCERTILVQIIIKDVVTCFFGTHCSVIARLNTGIKMLAVQSVFI